MLEANSVTALSIELTPKQILNNKYQPGVPNLSLYMYPFSISTVVHVPLNFHTTTRLSKIPKVH